MQSGKIPACEYVKLAIKRHLQDLQEGGSRGLYFDKDAAGKVLNFCGLVKQSKGKWAGQPLKLEGWQAFIVWVLFGWKRADGTRRFRTGYLEVARKNGKSTLLAALGLYLLCFDDESGAEVYSVATKEEQAKITLSEGQRMSEKSNNLGGRVQVFKKSITVPASYSSWKPLGRDSKSEDGLNVHGALIDELHAHPNSGMWDVVRSAMGSRSQPLMFAITTAGFNKQSFCYEQRNYAIKVLSGQITNDAYFGIIFTLDEADDWKDEKVWIKSNPNLGVSVNLEDMRSMCQEAIDLPTALNNFKVKKLNIWTTQVVAWMNMPRWEAADRVVDEKMLLGKDCYASIDLSTNTDLSCLGLLFPQGNDFVYLPKFWCPKDRAFDRNNLDNVPYLSWAEQGFIELTDGDVIDYDRVMSGIWGAFGKFNIIGVGFDRWNFEATRQRLLKEGVPEDKMISFGQGFASMSAPMKKLEELVLANRLIHNNNPVLTWMAANVAAKTDEADNIKPDKKESTERIDGIVALIMCIGIAITKLEEIDKIKNLLDVGI